MLALEPATRGRCCQTAAELLGYDACNAFELALLIRLGCTFFTCWLLQAGNVEQLTAAFCDSSLTHRSTCG